MTSRVEHRQGCPATGGYGHGVEPCICGADMGTEHGLCDLPSELLAGFREMDAAELEEAVRAYAQRNVEKALESQREGQWLAMDSVPRDGTRVLLAIQGVDRPILGYWDGESFSTIDGHNWAGRAVIGWRHLPRLPR